MRRAAAAVACVLIAAGSLCGETARMKLEEVRAGMKGVARTVFAGVTPEDIPVEVVDVLRRVSPGRDVILVRLKGEKIERMGVARGMSGAPVFIDGKLVGALAFSWPNLREPVAGITPIESMIDVGWEEPGDRKSPAPVAWRAGQSLPSEQFIEQLLKPRPAFLFVSPANMTTLETPICVRGFSRASVALLADRLRAFDVAVVEGGGTGSAAGAPANLQLEPGGTMCAQAVRGDFEVSAVGTVTEVAGSRVYGFGHPLFNNGVTEMPLATGYVHLVVPAQDMSFKVVSAVKPVGTLRVDHPSGVAGEIGRQPEMLKVTLDAKRRDLVGNARFNFEVVRDPRMLMTFLNATVGAALDVSGRPDTDVKIVVRATIEVEGHRPVVVEEVCGGPQAPTNALGTFVMPLGHIIHNPFARVNVKSLNIAVEVVPGDPRALIRCVETPKSDYRPGEEIDVAVTLQPWRGKSVIRHYRIACPSDAPEGALALIVCDPMSDERMETRDMPHRFRPEDVAGVLDFFRRERPTTDIVFRFSTSHPGIAIKGRELADLPDSVVSVLGKQSPTEVSEFSTTRVKREPTEFVIVGQRQIVINVVKK